MPKSPSTISGPDHPAGMSAIVVPPASAKARYAAAASGGRRVRVGAKYHRDIVKARAQPARDDERVAAVVARAGEHQHRCRRARPPSPCATSAAASPARSISGAPPAAASTTRRSTRPIDGQQRRSRAHARDYRPRRRGPPSDATGVRRRACAWTNPQARRYTSLRLRGLFARAGVQIAQSIRTAAATAASQEALDEVLSQSRPCADRRDVRAGGATPRN